jgi:hypothetical protein
MADILLDKVLPSTGEILSDGNIDYGRILKRLFDKGNYTVTINNITSTQTASTSDSIYISPGVALNFYSSVVQNLDSPDFKGTLNVNILNNTFSKSQIIFHNNSISSGSEIPSRITFVKPTSINGVTFSNYERFLNNSLIRLVGDFTSSFSDCFFNNYSKNNFAIVCEQTTIHCSNCSFTGQGTSLLAETTCSNVNFINNLNHGVGRAVKVNNSTTGCKVSLIENTLDIGGQLLWSNGKILSNSIIQYNVVEYHSRGLTNEPNNGQVIYILGQIDGLQISDNIFSGADRINGDVLNTTQTDSFIPRRPISCITLDGNFIKNNVNIRRN